MPKGKKSGHGKSRFIEFRGSARYRIRARTREEALEMARERFEHEAFDKRQSFELTGIAATIRSVVGFEAERTTKDMPHSRALVLEWRNKPSQEFRTGDDKHPAFPRQKQRQRKPSKGRQEKIS